MRVVVTGATGNVGTAVLSRLHDEPAVESIVGIARRLPDTSVEPYRAVTWHALDVGENSDAASLQAILAGADTVIHLAWALQPNHDERAMRRTNVRGTANMLAAAANQNVSQVIVASSVGAYSFGPKRRRVDETWPTGGIQSSHYGRHKAINERAMDAFERGHPEITLTRMRPGLIFQESAGAEIAGLFLGRNFPTGWLRTARPAVLPLPSGLIVQAVHATDVADAYVRAAVRRAAGAFNIAAEPVLTPELIAAAFGSSATIPFRAAALRAIMAMTWRLRLQASDPGWLDIAVGVPVMSTERARAALGWSPAVPATDALACIVDAIGTRANSAASAPLNG